MGGGHAHGIGSPSGGVDLQSAPNCKQHQAVARGRGAKALFGARSAVVSGWDLPNPVKAADMVVHAALSVVVSVSSQPGIPAWWLWCPGVLLG